MRIYEMLKLDSSTAQSRLSKRDEQQKGRKDIIKIDTLIDLNYDMIAYVDSNVVDTSKKKSAKTLP